MSTQQPNSSDALFTKPLLKSRLKKAYQRLEGALEHSSQTRVETHEIIPGVDLVILEDLQQLGEYNAYRLAEIIESAKQQGKRVVIDMPTGSSPKSTWEALAKMVESGKVDISNVIWIGHEADRPSRFKISYEQQRHEILQKLGVTIKPITLEDARNGKFDGNYVSMHQIPLNYPTKREEVETDAKKSAQQYDKILSLLFEQDNILPIGLHGVGEDSHGWGELQLSHMWPDTWKETLQTFVESSNSYTPKGGLWRLLTDDKFDPGQNFVGHKHPGISLMGLGRQTLLQLEQALEIFNDPKKATALRKTIEALQGKNPEKGEDLLPDFKSYAVNTLGLKDCQDMSTCHEVYQTICSALSDNDDSSYHDVWKLVNEYFGSMTPVAKMILERQARGKRTTLVTTKEVASGII